MDLMRMMMLLRRGLAINYAVHIITRFLERDMRCKISIRNLPFAGISILFDPFVDGSFSGVIGCGR